MPVPGRTAERDAAEQESASSRVPSGKLPPVQRKALNDTPADPSSVRILNLMTTLNDVYEYHGITALGLFMLYFIIANLSLTLHWDYTTPPMKAFVEQSFTAYGPQPWLQTPSSSVASMSDTVAYVMGYANETVWEAQARAFPNQMLIISEYGRVLYMRITANLDTNCMWGSTLLCYKRDDDGSAGVFNTSGLWRPLEGLAPSTSLPFSLYVTPYSSSTTSLNQTYNILQAIAADTAYLGVFAFSVSVELVVQNLQAPGDLAYFALTATRAGFVNDKPSETFYVKSTALALTECLYSTPLDYARAALEACYCILTLYFIFEEADQMQQSVLQYGLHRGFRHYFLAWWNKLDILGLMFSLAQCAWYATLCAQRGTLVPYDGSEESTKDAVEFGLQYTTWMYASILANLLIGVRVLKYMKLHPALRIYSQVISYAWKRLRDFLWFFLYVMLLLGSGMLAFFQISGGNILFATVPSGISSMALLTFAFLDYATFVNGSLGLGSWAPSVILVFWIAVALLIVISQNIILAIVASAYEEAKMSEGPIEAPIVRLLWMRAVFEIRHFWSLLKMESVHDFSAGLVTEFESAVVQRRLGHYEGNLYQEYLFARWGVALLPESKAILGYFMCAASDKLRRTSPWEADVPQFKNIRSNTLRRSHADLVHATRSRRPSTNGAASMNQQESRVTDSFAQKNGVEGTDSFWSRLKSCFGGGRAATAVAPLPSSKASPELQDPKMSQANGILQTPVVVIVDGQEGSNRQQPRQSVASTGAPAKVSTPPTPPAAPRAPAPAPPPPAAYWTGAVAASPVAEAVTAQWKRSIPLRGGASAAASAAWQPQTQAVVPPGWHHIAPGPVAEASVGRCHQPSAWQLPAGNTARWLQSRLAEQDIESGIGIEKLPQSSYSCSSGATAQPADPPHQLQVQPHWHPDPQSRHTTVDSRQLQARALSSTQALWHTPMYGGNHLGWGAHNPWSDTVPCSQHTLPSPAAGPVAEGMRPRMAAGMAAAMTAVDDNDGTGGSRWGGPGGGRDHQKHKGANGAWLMAMGGDNGSGKVPIGVGITAEEERELMTESGVYSVAFLQRPDLDEDEEDEQFVADLAVPFTARTLRALLLGSMPRNARFNGSRHLIFRTASWAYKPDCMPRCAELMWRVYSQPAGPPRAMPDKKQPKGGLWFSQGATMHNTLDDINWEVYKLAQEVKDLRVEIHASQEARLDRIERMLVTLTGGPPVTPPLTAVSGLVPATADTLGRQSVTSEAGHDDHDLGSTTASAVGTTGTTLKGRPKRASAKKGGVKKKGTGRVSAAGEAGEASLPGAAV